MAKPIQTYEAPGITVTFDPNICTHSGACVRCPSGALQCRLAPKDKA